MTHTMCLLALWAPANAAGTTVWEGRADLKPGAPIERELKGGESHSYRVLVEAGQYLRAAVEQKGVDVVVRLYAPSGRMLLEVDSPNGAQGPEPVAFIAEEVGEYRLEIVAADEKAAPGRYEARVEELRAAVPRDRDRVAADGALAEAERFRSAGKGDSLRKALEKYDVALPPLRALDDRGREALTLHRMGLIYWQLGENQKAVDYYRLALPLRRAVGDRQGEAHTLNGIGLAYEHLGMPQESLEYLNQSLTLRRELGDRRGEANTLSNIGASYYALGDIQKSLEYYAQALTIWRSVSDRRGEAATLSNMGVSYWQLGDGGKALEYYNLALPLRRETSDRPGEASTLQNIGLVYWSSGDPRKALDSYIQALALMRELGNRRDEAAILHNMGAAYRSLGDFGKSLDLYTQALRLRREAADRWGEALTLSHIGAVYATQGKHEESLGYLGQALSLQRAMGDRVNEAGTLLNLARAERAGGRLAESRASIEAALGIIEGTRSQFLNRRLRTQFSASRADYYQFYVELLMSMHGRRPLAGHDAEALAASERARARGLLEMLTESGAEIRRGGDAGLLARERSLQQKLGFKSEQLTRLLAGTHTDEQERAATKEVENLLEEFETLKGEIRTRSPRYASLTQPRPLSAAEIRKELDPGTLLLEYSLGEERGYLWAVTSSSVQSFELPGRAEVEGLARRAYESLTARNKVVGFEEARERSVRLARADAEFLRAGGALSEMLLGPAAHLMKTKRLLIVGDGVLQYLPFAAIPLPRSVGRGAGRAAYVPVITRHEVVSLPSSSTLALLRREFAGRRPAPRAVAVIADPVFEAGDGRVKSGEPATAARRQPPPSAAAEGVAAEDALTRSVRDVTASDVKATSPFPRLPFTRLEAEAIVALAPQGQSEKALDFAASREAALDPRLSRYRYVHFATHTILNEQHPELSGIVLSLVDQAGHARRGFLLAHEVYNLNLPAELTVLSGCRTGLGKDVRGEGMVGLTRGFMYAGSPRVLVSLWDVNDQSTAELMSRFYKGVLRRPGLSPAAALRQAQLAMWMSPRWRAPFYWAAFALHGEYK